MEQKYIDRFHTRYEVKPNGCWEWTGSKDKKMGYGTFWIKPKDWLAHRASYLIHKGDPASMCVCHSCDNPACVNPDHLWLGTRSDNNRDRDHKGRHVVLCGSTNGFAKLTESDVLAIRASTLSVKELSKRYKVSDENIRHVLARNTWKHI